MRTRVGPQFREEATRYDLRFTCEWCVHYDGNGETCSNGYPTEAHRQRDLNAIDWLSFCKLFELC